jgi:predicted Zn-dependent protease
MKLFTARARCAAGLSVILLLAGCSTATAPVRQSGPVTVEERSGTPASAPSAAAETVPAPAPATPPTVQTRPPAVVALLDHAEQQANSGDLDAAAASLERAIRIDPRNAVLWYHLATVRLAQGIASQAEQLAVKSNSLATGNRVQQSRNWELIARARRQMNDADGAVAAERRARELGQR